MRRREFITLVGGAAAAAWPLAAGAQQAANVARIGFMRAASPNEKEFNAFRSGLRTLGYVEGQNIVIEQRYAAGAYDRLGELVAELVRLKMDVIVVDGPPAAKSKQGHTWPPPRARVETVQQLKRREFVSLVGGAAAWPPAVRAQSPAMPVVGFLDPTSFVSPEVDDQG